MSITWLDFNIKHTTLKEIKDRKVIDSVELSANGSYFSPVIEN